MPSRRGQSSDLSAVVDMSLIEESAHKVLMQGIDSDGVATNDVMQDHRSYWDDDGEEAPSPATHHKSLDESRKTRGTHSRLESFGHWASSKVRGSGTLWFIHSGNNSPVGWPWVGTVFILIFITLLLLVLLCLFALDDAEVRSQQKRQDDMAFSYSTLISSRLMLMVSSLESVTGLAQGSMMASVNRTGLETKNGSTLLPHFEKHATAALDRMLLDLPRTSSGTGSAWILSVPSAVPAEMHPYFLESAAIGLNFLKSSWKPTLIETALTGKVSIATYVLRGLEYVGVIVPVFNESAPQSQRDQRAANRAKYSKMPVETLLGEASPNITTFEHLEAPGFAPGLWGWVAGFMQGRPFVNGTGLVDDMNATLGGLDMSWCLYSIDPYVYSGEMLVLGSSREGKSSSGMLDAADNITVFFNNTGSLELDPQPGEYCTEMLDSVTSSRRGASKVIIPAKLDRFRTVAPWVLLMRSNTNSNYLSSRNIAISVFATLSVAAIAVVTIYCILMCRRKSSDTPASAPKTTPFTFMSVRLVEGEMLWKCCPEAALDLVEKFGIIVREAARDHDLYDCQPDAPHAICFASRSVAPAVRAAEMFLERLSVLRYPMSVSMDMWDAEESASRRAAERRVLVEELEKRATQTFTRNTGDGSASPPASVDMLKDVSSSRQRPISATKLLRPTQVRPFLVQVLIQRCDNGRVLYDVQSSRFKYNPTLSSVVVDRLCATNVETNEPHCMPNCIHLNEAAAKEARKTVSGALLEPNEPFVFETPQRLTVGSSTSVDTSNPLSPTTAPRIALFTYTNATHNATLDQSRERARVQLANRATRNDILYANILASYKEAQQAGWGVMQKAPFHSVPGNNTVRRIQHKRVGKAAPKSTPIIIARHSNSSDSAPLNSESDERRGDDLEPPPSDVWGVSGTRSLQDASRHLNIPPQVDHILRTVFDQYIPNFIEALQRSADLSKDLTRDMRQRSDSGTVTSSLSAPNSVFVSSGEGVDEQELSHSTTPSESVSTADISHDALYQRFRIRLFVYVNALQVMFSAYTPEERGQLLERLRLSFQVEIPQELVIHHLAAACCLANDLANLPLGRRHPVASSEREASIDRAYHSPWGSEPASTTKTM